MDEALAKSGDWPNVAIEAGSDPEQVMREYGVRPCMEDGHYRTFERFVKLAKDDCYDPERYPWVTKEAI